MNGIAVFKTARHISLYWASLILSKLQLNTAYPSRFMSLRQSTPPIFCMHFKSISNHFRDHYFTFSGLTFCPFHTEPYRHLIQSNIFDSKNCVSVAPTTSTFFLSESKVHLGFRPWCLKLHQIFIIPVLPRICSGLLLSHTLDHTGMFWQLYRISIRNVASTINIEEF
jgi:hypothetical protein